MTIRYVLQTNNRYVQYRYKLPSVTNTDFSNIRNWETFDVFEGSSYIDKIPTKFYKGYLKKDNTLGESDILSSEYSDIIECTDGDKFIYHGYGYGNNVNIIQVTNDNDGVSWIFYDSQKQFVSAWAVGQYGKYIVEIPTGVSYIRFSSIVKTPTRLMPSAIYRYNSIVGDSYNISSTKVPILENEIRALSEDVLDYNNRMLLDGYINNEDGKFIEYTTVGYKTLFLDVEDGSVIDIYVNDKQTNNAKYFAFYGTKNVQNNTLSVNNTKYNYIIGKTKISVPPGAVCIGIISTFNNVGSEYNITVSVSKVNSIKTEIEGKNQYLPIYKAIYGVVANPDGHYDRGAGFASCVSIYQVTPGDELIIVSQTELSNGVKNFAFYNTNNIEDGTVAIDGLHKYTNGLTSVIVPAGSVTMAILSIFNNKGSYDDTSVCKKDSVVGLPLLYSKVLEKSGEWNNIKWVAIGDSLTENNIRALKNYHDYIKEWTDINVVNRGRSGSGYKEAYQDNAAFYQRV